MTDKNEFDAANSAPLGVSLVNFFLLVFPISFPTNESENMKVLICEDHEVEMKVIQVALAEENIEWITARDGRKALRILEENNDFDLIITDIHMPYNNGDEILHLVREQQKKNTPIIMISSDDQEEVIKLALKLGVNEFLEKPIDPEMVRRKVRKHLKK
jgi:PleD family two-component response regulator